MGSAVKSEVMEGRGVEEGKVDGCLSDSPSGGGHQRGLEDV